MFYLKSSKDKKNTSIFLFFRSKWNNTNISVKYPVGYSIHPDNWNKEKKIARSIAGTNYKVINKRIKQIKKYLDEILDEYPKDELTDDLIREQLDIRLGIITKSGDKKLTFFEFFDDYINDLKSRKGDNTAKPFRVTYKKLKTKYPTLTWSGVNYKFYQSFTKYLGKRRGSGQRKIPGRIFKELHR